MRKAILILTSASAALIGVAHATPTMGAASHRLGGEAAGSYAPKEKEATSLIEVFLGVISFDFSAKATPVADRNSVEKTSKAKECKQSKSENTEVAQAESKAGSDKTKGLALEPMYLAF
ncbi:MAG: hypothetical protein R3C40_10890 [Parvularculaceae bacterium]